MHPQNMKAIVPSCDVLPMSKHDLGQFSARFWDMPTHGLTRGKPERAARAHVLIMHHAESGLLYHPGSSSDPQASRVPITCVTAVISLAQAACCSENAYAESRPLIAIHSHNKHVSCCFLLTAI